MQVETQRVYLESCEKYNLKPDSTILVALNCKMTHLSLSPTFDVANLLPLRDALRHDTTITSISFRRCALGSTACYPLRDILKENKSILRINLDNNGIDYHGATALAEALKVNDTLEEINLRSNYLKLPGAIILAGALKENRGLKFVDVAANLMTNEGIRAIETACTHRNIKSDTSGNAVREEVLNSITHGFGILLSVIGGLTLASDAQGYGRPHRWGIGLYVTSLVVLYMSSTLCHSFVFMKKTGQFFQILDHAAIYVLIAGTYTPFCFVNLSSESWTGTILATIIWVLAFFGMVLSLYQVNIVYELCLYMSMGWLIVLTGSEMINSIPQEALVLMVAGGFAYTGGVYFFVLGIKTPMNHVIWHLFVLAGSVLHFFAIREAIFQKSPTTSLEWLSTTLQDAVKDNWSHLKPDTQCPQLFEK